MSSKPDPLEYDFGYDPTIDEPIEITPPTPVITLPLSAKVNTEYLPPVGQQHTPNCAAWASTYGLATFTAARAGQYAPNEPSLQASSAFIYIQVLKQDGVSQDNCCGSQLMSYFNILAGGGTPTMAQAPYAPNCTTLWQDYSNQTLKPDPTFTISSIPRLMPRFRMMSNRSLPPVVHWLTEPLFTRIFRTTTPLRYLTSVIGSST